LDNHAIVDKNDLIYAAKNGLSYCLVELLDPTSRRIDSQGINVNESFGSSENTMLHLAVEKDHPVLNFRIDFDSNPQQGCHIFLGTKYQNGKNIPNYHELYLPNVHKI
jgi:hypothetical protein